MSFDIICFDCDSTLSRVEGIDELARRAGLFEPVAELTTQAMNGELALEDVYENRLALIRPNAKSINWLAQLYIDQVVPGASETISRLQQYNKQVHIISGGLQQAILPLADFLGIPALNVHAVAIQFDEQGEYLGFQKNTPLANSGGKAETCRRIMNNNDTVAMVGDGKTDLEAREAGATVIGFGGVVARDSVREQADFFVSGPSLTAVLDYLI